MGTKRWNQSTSEPLEQDLEVIGYPRMVLHASTSGPDTDWVIKLCDVHPDGKTYCVTDGILRARYRKSPDAPELLEPGEIAAYEIELYPTAMAFLAGHRIKIMITSSDFPRYGGTSRFVTRTALNRTLGEHRQGAAVGALSDR